MKKLLMTVLLATLLVGCKSAEDEPMLAVPTNLVHEEDAIRWDAVDDAGYYTVEIDGTEELVSTNEYSLLELADGTYVFRVRANRMDRQSEFSEPLEITLSRTYEIPRNVNYQGGVLEWTLDGEAISFEVAVNDQTYTTETTQMTLPFHEDGLFTIRVKAIYATGSSVWSEPVYHHTFPEASQAFDADFNRLLPIDLRVDAVLTEPVIALFRNGRGFLPDEWLDIQTDRVYIASSWLAVLTPGEHVIQIITTSERIDVTLEVYEDASPAMISPNTVLFEGNDLSFEFALFGGEFVTVSGADIGTADYVFDDDTLIVSASFISAIATEQPDRETVILSYQLSAQDDITIGYIFIRLHEETPTQ